MGIQQGTGINRKTNTNTLVNLMFTQSFSNSQHQQKTIDRIRNRFSDEKINA